MKSINEVRILGRLGKDAEAKTFPNGGGITKLIIATEYSYKDKTNPGEFKKEVEWTTCIIRGSKAQTAARFKKGEAVEVNGRLKTRSYEVNGEKRYAVEVLAFEATPAGYQQQPREQVNGNRVDDFNF